LLKLRRLCWSIGHGYSSHLEGVEVRLGTPEKQIPELRLAIKIKANDFNQHIHAMCSNDFPRAIKVIS
jgi:hypothetical protein